MKPIDQLMNVDKAKSCSTCLEMKSLHFWNIPKQLPIRLQRTKELLANWTNSFLSFYPSPRLSEQVNSTIKKYGRSLAKSVNLCAGQLFDGYLALFSKHCLEQYKFKLAIRLLYLSV
ncbi:hypothetical protein [Mucilaginibacter sp.]